MPAYLFSCLCWLGPCPAPLGGCVNVSEKLVPQLLPAPYFGLLQHQVTIIPSP